MAELRDGTLFDKQVTQEIIPKLEQGLIDLAKIKAIVIHQTHSTNAAGSISSWKEGRLIKSKSGKTIRIYPGTHFIIDRGSGNYTDKGKTYNYTGIDGKITQTARVNRKCSHVMKQKSKLYPTNSNSIGIELVGMWTEADGYPDSSVAQINAATWLVTTLISLISTFPKSDNLYAHGAISFEKKESEGVKSLESIQNEMKKRNADKEDVKQISVHTTIPINIAPMAIDNTRVSMVYFPDRFFNEE